MDTSTVTATKGYYDAASNTLTWTADSDSDLASLAPGQTGQLSFALSPLANDSSDINAQLSVQGTLPGTNYQQQSIDDIDMKTIRFSAHLQFASQAFYSVGPIKNTGTIPAKSWPGYHIHYYMDSSSFENPLTNVSASAVLPQGVDWTGVISPQSSALTYSADTRTVTWNVGVLPKATLPPKQVQYHFK